MQPSVCSIRVLYGGRELQLVASGFFNPAGVRFIDNTLRVSDINGDFIAGKRELPDGFIVKIQALQTANKSQMKTEFFASPKPRVFAHRGASGEAPENTLPAFRLALERKVPYAELDVHSSRDGHIVVIHDATLERTTNGKGKVHDHTLKELKQLDAGYHFSPDEGKTHPFRGTEVTLSTLEEVLTACPGMKFVIEIKQTEPPIEDKVIAVVKKSKREKEVVLASEHDSVMVQVRQLAPEVAASFSTGEAREFIERVYNGQMQDYLPPALALQIPPEYRGIPLVTEETVAKAHALGTEIHVWTINDPLEMERLLNLGVDGIMSDWPGRLREVVEGWLQSRYNSN